MIYVKIRNYDSRPMYINANFLRVDYGKTICASKI